MSSEIVSFTCLEVIWSRSVTPSARAVSTVGRIRRTSWGMKEPSVVRGVFVESNVAFTAPQESWPSTKINGTLSTSTENSSDPTIVSAIIWPAFRTTKRSPSPTSKIISAASLESEQPKSAAKGFCSLAKSLRSSASWRGWAGVPLTKLLFPAARADQASVALDGLAIGNFSRYCLSKQFEISFARSSIDYNRIVSKPGNHGVVPAGRRV